MTKQSLRDRWISELIDIADSLEFFQGPQELGGLFFSAQGQGCIETWPAITPSGNASSQLRRWVTKLHRHRYAGFVSGAVVDDALRHIIAQQLDCTSRRAVGIRVLGDLDRVHVDLCDEEWRSVEITPAGWELRNGGACDVRFVRRRGMLQLPAPTRGGALGQLRALINCPDDNAWRLLVGWLIMTFHPRGPYPVLIISGEQGSAKSTLCRLLRDLVDPNVAPLRRMPSNERDLMIAAKNGWVMGADNLSGVTQGMSDALCSLATGGGFSTRALYTDDEEAVFQASRPILLNGIHDPAERSDLIDRSIRIELPSIPNENRQEESTIDREFDRIRPAVLGALFDAVACALSGYHTCKVDAPTRMADFCRFVAAASPALGWGGYELIDALRGNRAQSRLDVVEASPIGPPLLRLVESRSPWEGTASDLLVALSASKAGSHGIQDGFPRNARALGVEISRIAPCLQQVGLKVERVRMNDPNRRRIIRILKIDGKLSNTSREGES